MVTALAPVLGAVLVTLLLVPAGASSSAAATAPRRPVRDDHPLAVRIDTLTPSYVPRQGPVRVAGTVTNRSDETWEAINVHAFIGTTPITSSSELAIERQREAREYVGDRIYRTGTFDAIGSLEPGESVRFSLEVSRSLLGVTSPGVYWFGVHALGQSALGRDDVADGRARTFLPLVAPTRRSVSTALVIPVRRSIRHTGDGRIAGVAGWASDLDVDGRLRAIVDFGASAGSRSITWLIDPAVIDAVQALVHGNLPRSLTEAPDSPAGEESPDPGDEETAAPADSRDPEVATNAATEPGSTWLDRLGEAVDGTEVLGLPYGDLDVSAALKRDPSMYHRARRRTGDVLAPFGAPVSPAVSSPSGYLDPSVIDDLTPETTILMSDTQLGDALTDDTATSMRVDRRQVRLASSATALGGPGPDAPLGTIALRQQILAEASLRLASAGKRPLLVVLPPRWVPDGFPGFFTGLDVPWLTLTGVDTLTTRRGPAVEGETLGYPTQQIVRELDAANFASAEGLLGLGRTLEAVLVDNDSVDASVRDEALTGLSYASRDYAEGARAEADRSSRWISTQLGSIRVVAPRAVTLSSSRGGFSVIVTNGLEQPVRVRLESVADAPMKIGEAEPIEIPAGGRASVLLDASTVRLGVHNVELVVTTANGTPLGSTDTVPIRSNQVSDVIWVIMGTGVALLFGAIVIRLVRRIRRSRAGAAA